MRRSDWEDRCKRHPEHRLSRGVCPFCLRDRLARLSVSSSAATTLASTSAATSPSYSSAEASPPPHHAAMSADVSSVHVVRGGAASDGSSFVDVAAFSQPMMPSAVSRKPAGKEDAAAALGGERQTTKGKGDAVKKKKSGKNKKIGRFLSRLVGAEKRRQAADGDELFHSKTMKEKSASKWVFF